MPLSTPGVRAGVEPTHLLVISPIGGGGAEANGTPSQENAMSTKFCHTFRGVLAPGGFCVKSPIQKQLLDALCVGREAEPAQDACSTLTNCDTCTRMSDIIRDVFTLSPSTSQ